MHHWTSPPVFEITRMKAVPLSDSEIALIAHCRFNAVLCDLGEWDWKQAGSGPEIFESSRYNRSTHKWEHLRCRRSVVGEQVRFLPDALPERLQAHADKLCIWFDMIGLF